MPLHAPNGIDTKQDNAPYHTAVTSQELPQEQETKLKGKPSSPDPTLIEHLRDGLEQV